MPLLDIYKMFNFPSGHCKNYWRLDSMFDNTCTGEYSRSLEDEEDYVSGWGGPNSTHSSGPWSHSDQSDLGTLPLWGNLAVYSGGGYVLQHYPSYQTAVSHQNTTFSHKWLDKYTRAVVAEFVIYNANANLFAVVSILMEMTATGSINKYLGCERVEFVQLFGKLCHI